MLKIRSHAGTVSPFTHTRVAAAITLRILGRKLLISSASAHSFSEPISSMAAAKSAAALTIRST
jgi:hypothetical protein